MILKRLSTLNGLAILAVVCNHATSMGYIAMFWWTDQYRPVTTPNFDQLGTPGYYSLVAVQVLTLFCVPAFFFAAGFFIAYAARGEQGLTWKMVRARITRLLWPYLIWSAVMLIGQAGQGTFYAPGEYVRKILTGAAISPYYFVPVLVQFYLLSPFIVQLARTQPRRLLGGAAVVQLVSISLVTYWQITTAQATSSSAFLNVSWVFTLYAFYFPFGVVAGLHWKTIQAAIVRHRRIWVLLTLAFGLVSIAEDSWLRLVINTPPSWQAVAFSSSLYAVSLILAFLSFEGSQQRGGSTLSWLGARSYGLYLIHFPLLELSARLIRRVFPAFLSQQFLLVWVLAAIAIGIVALFMEGVARSPVRKVYRYLFG